MPFPQSGVDGIVEDMKMFPKPVDWSNEWTIYRFLLAQVMRWNQPFPLSATIFSNQWFSDDTWCLIPKLRRLLSKLFAQLN
jgi:hypothetical protein